MLLGTVACKDKTLPRIQKHFPGSKNTSQDPKHVPESKTLPRIQKHVPEFKNASKNLKTLPRIQKNFPESKTRPRIQKHFPRFSESAKQLRQGLRFKLHLSKIKVRAISCLSKLRLVLIYIWLVEEMLQEFSADRKG